MAKFTTRAKPGIYYDVPFELYQRAPYVHNSLLKYALRSPAHYKMEIDKSPAELAKEKRSDAIKLGDLFNKIAVEDMSIDEVCERVPAGYFHFRENANTFRRRLREALEVFRCDELTSELMEGKREVVIVWDDEKTGLRCKSRLDVLRDMMNFRFTITDVKTTRDAWQFPADIRRFGYQRQMAFYRDGLLAVVPKAKVDVYISAIELDRPYGLRSARLHGDLIQQGRRLYQVAMDRIAKAVGQDTWTSSDHPRWWNFGTGDDHIYLENGDEVS